MSRTPVEESSLSEIALQHARRLEGWLTRHRTDGSVAVILGGSSGGLSFARSLGRRGIPVLLLETERFLGTYTRYGKVVLLPPADEFAKDWIEILTFVGSRLARPGVLFPTSDVHSLLVSRHTDILRRYFRFLVPDRQKLELIVNKRSQYGLAQATGIPIPRVYFPESVEELRQLSAEVAYPCLLKPYDSHAARKKLGKDRKVLVVTSQSEMVSAYERITADDVRLMVQEFIPGEDSALFGYLAFWDSQGREFGWLTKRKLRQFPARFGDGSLQTTVEAPEVAELSRRLLRAFDYRGFVGVEFKLDARDRTYRLMEINPRIVSGNQLAISAGVDFPWIGYQYLTGSDRGAGLAGGFRPGVKYVNEEWDVQAYVALRKSGAISLGSWLRSVRGANALAFGAWDDPSPLVVGFGRFVWKLWSDCWSAERAGTTSNPIGPQ